MRKEKLVNQVSILLKDNYFTSFTVKEKSSTDVVIENEDNDTNVDSIQFIIKVTYQSVNYLDVAELSIEDIDSVELDVPELEEPTEGYITDIYYVIEDNKLYLRYDVTRDFVLRNGYDFHLFKGSENKTYK